MKCPKCKSPLESAEYEGVEFERCSSCRGLWFDMLEKEDLLAMRGSESIDIGADQVGEHYSKRRDVDCPKCRQPMIPMVDRDQYHIQYEACPLCFGTFFDAGEFRDLKEFTVAERFRRMLQTLRSNL